MISKVTDYIISYLKEENLTAVQVAINFFSSLHITNQIT